MTPVGVPTPQPTASEPSLRSIVLTTVAGLLLVVGVVFLLSVTLRGPLESVAAELVVRFGYVGIGVGTLAADMLTVPIPVDVYLLIGIAGGAAPFWVIAAASVGTVLGGIGAFAIGLWLGNRRWVARLVTRFRARHGALVERWGLVAVVIAALTPLPFSIICYIAGSLRLRFVSFLLAACFRVPRIAGYYYLMQLGWTA